MNESKQSMNSSSTIDPGILEMGASVSVNDELRRAINAETIDIESICTKLVSDVGAEETHAKEIQKSKHHSDVELSNILQCSMELVETSHMNEHIFRGLQAKVEKELVLSSYSQGKILTDNANIANKKDVMPQSPTSVFAIQQSNVKKSEDVTTLSKSIRDTIASIKYFKDQIINMEHETNQIYHKVKSEHLKVTLANAKHQVHLAEDILKDKQMQHQKDKINYDIIDARCKHLNEKKDAMVRTFNFVFVCL
jgi:hypothetical protein